MPDKIDSRVLIKSNDFMAFIQYDISILLSHAKACRYHHHILNALVVIEEN